jgi:hypothetical protein
MIILYSCSSDSCIFFMSERSWSLENIKLLHYVIHFAQNVTVEWVTVLLRIHVIAVHISTRMPDILNELFEDHLSASRKMPATTASFHKLFITPKLFYNSTSYYPRCWQRRWFKQHGWYSFIVFLLELHVLGDIYCKYFNGQEKENGRESRMMIGYTN